MTSNPAAALLTLINEYNDDDISSKVIELPAQDTWPSSIHRLDDQELRSIVAALAAERPLLVRGEPGVGKSHLARAVAAMLEWHFISHVVQPQTEHQDLLWTFDHVKRLADAQLGRVESDVTPENWLEPQNYITPGPLWWAFDPSGDKPPGRSSYRPDPELENNKAINGVVMLIDEIDKADISLCNGLLEVLGNGAFSVPDWHARVIANRACPPFVIMTSNDTRQLPNAFLRRCVLLDLALPSGDALVQHLVDIGGVHFPKMHTSVRTQAAQQIKQDREHGTNLARTGQAEYLDLLRALNSISQNKKINCYGWIGSANAS